MNSQNNFYSKGVEKKMPLLFGFVFTLFLLIFSNCSVYALPKPTLTETHYIEYRQTYPNNPNITIYYFAQWSNDGYCVANTGTDNNLAFYNSSNAMSSPSYTYSISYDNEDWTTPSVGGIYINDFIAVNKQFVITGGDTLVYNSISDKTIPLYSPIPIASYVNFIQPSINPYKDTTSAFNFLISYKVPVNTPVSQIDINVNGTNISSSQFSITSQDHNLATGEGWVKFLASDVSVGSHTITCTVNQLSDNTNIERLNGSVDSDGDGIDDRTGQPVDNGSVTNNSVYPTDITTSVNSLTGFMASMKSFSTQLFSFMPNEVKVIMVFVITVMGFIAIKKFIL